MTQTGMAEKCKFKAQSRISQYENHEREPCLESLNSICRVLNVDPPTLFRRAEIESGRTSKEKPYHDELQTNFDRLSKEKKASVLDLIRGLLD